MQSTVESVIGSLREVMRLPGAEQQRITLELLQQNILHHYGSNAFFRAQCDAVAFDPYAVDQLEDLLKLPLIPMKTFKSPNSHVLLSVPLTDIELEIKSTGTSGIPSVTRRDSRTVDRAAMAMLALYREFFAFSRGSGVFLAPSLAESPEMGMVKALNIFCGLLSEAKYLVKDYAFYPEDALEALKAAANKETRYIFGPPFLVSRLLAYMEENDLRIQLDPQSFIIMIGGWKRFTGEFIGRDQLLAKIEDRLGLPANRVRDMYGMVEANVLAIECEHHNKHMPPWCHLSIRSLTDPNQEVEQGEEGVIALLDATSLSYPGFILSEDVGACVGTSCPCGREGPIVTFYRRVEGGEYGCCAVSLEKFIETREIVASCKIDAAE